MLCRRDQGESVHLRILWLAHRDLSNPKAGGAERTIYEICRRLAKHNHKITLLASGWKNCKRYERLEQFNIVRIGQNLVTHLFLPAILIRGNYDIVINDLGHVIPWVSTSILGRKNVVFFRHLHARSLGGQVNWMLARFLSGVEKMYPMIYPHAKFVTESTTSMGDLNKIGIAHDRIAKIEPGVDLSVFKTGIKTHFPSIVYFGGMRKYKRPDECLYIFKNILEKFPRIRMFVIGDGPEYQNTLVTAKQLNLLGFVDFKGRLGTSELSEIVSQSWLNIHTSVTEGWGLSIIEAAACGTPTVAYRVPGIIDVIEDGLNGIKVEDGNRVAMADAVTKILTDPAHWWITSAKVAGKYSWDLTAKRWEELLEKIATS